MRNVASLLSLRKREVATLRRVYLELAERLRTGVGLRASLHIVCYCERSRGTPLCCGEVINSPSVIIAMTEALSSRATNEAILLYLVEIATLRRVYLELAERLRTGVVVWAPLHIVCHREPFDWTQDKLREAISL
jgi:hypothetical protein